jgi:CheY-like chemotaxis protein
MGLAMATKAKVLAVDDEAFNLDIIQFALSRSGFDVICAEDGLEGLRSLEENPDVEIIVLDRMMPNLDGMQFLATIKKDPRYSDIPVVMQTAAARSEEVLQGIEAGAYYYLTKPYEHAMLLGIVKSALHDAESKKQLKEEVKKYRSVIGLLEESRFRFRTLEEAKNLAYYVSACFPEPERAVYGLHELLINAVEHGNLGITYAEKSQLISSGEWNNEIERRLSRAENLSKYGTLIITLSEDHLKVLISDKGSGFNWHKYMEFSAERATDTHGRGIATARAFSFDTLEYLGCGNEVVVGVNTHVRAVAA